MSDATLALAGFLLARITEDESVAHRVIADRRHLIKRGNYLSDPDIDGALYADQDGKVPHVSTSAERVLAECAAKRRIIAMTDARREELWAMEMDEHRLSFEAWASKHPHDPTLRALAAVYRDHQDYDHAWAI